MIESEIIRFSYPIREAIAISGLLVVRLETPPEITFNENVFGVSLAEKRIKWQIAKREYHLKNCPFVDVKIFQGQLILYNWCDVYFVVDPATGKIELGIKEDQSIQSIITLKVYEFPYIGFLWIGIIIMVAGFVISIVHRVRTGVRVTASAK